MAFHFIYLIPTQKTYLEHSISEQSALCSIFPESEKNSMANSVSLLYSRAEVLFLLRAPCIKDNIQTLRFKHRMFKFFFSSDITRFFYSSLTLASPKCEVHPLCSVDHYKI